MQLSQLSQGLPLVQTAIAMTLLASQPQIIVHQASEEGGGIDRLHRSPLEFATGSIGIPHLVISMAQGQLIRRAKETTERRFTLDDARDLHDQIIRDMRSLAPRLSEPYNNALAFLD